MTIGTLAVAALVASQSIAAQVRVDRPMPRFPPILLSAGVSGSVRARYLVDSTGRVDMMTLTMDSSHPLFSSAVKTALVNARFETHPHASRREELFIFSNPTDAPPIEIAVRDSTPDGLPRTTVGYPSLDSNAAIGYNTGELVAAAESVASTIIDSIAATFPNEHKPVFCLADRDSATSRLLNAKALRAVAMSECPRTYAGIIRRVDSLGRTVDHTPPGWINPYRITIESVAPWTVGVVRVIIDVDQGAAGGRHLCGTGRDAAATPTRCEVVLRWAS